MNKKETKKTWRSEDYIKMMGEPTEEELTEAQKRLKAEKRDP